MKFLNEYPISLSTNYVSSWGLWEAVRELIQNALDSDKGHSIDYDEGSEELTIISYGQRLEPRNLLLGGSSKTGNSYKIGEHGEGKKLAALVLLREGYGISIQNQNLKWVSEIKFSETFQEDLLVFTEYDTGIISQNLEVVISGISFDEYLDIKAKCLHLGFYDDESNTIKETSYGNILLNHGGSIYVNGLYVCDQDIKHGYDIKPQHISLDRDRRSVSHWDSGILFSKMWEEVGFDQEQADEFISGVQDYRNSYYRMDRDSKQKVIDSVVEKYGEVYFVSNQGEFDEAKEMGYERIVFLNTDVHSVVMESGLYTPPEPESGLKEILSPEEYIEQFIEELIDQGYSSVCTLEIFDRLRQESEKWIRR